MYNVLGRLIPESIPWLAANGKVKEAEEILKKAARMNKVVLPDHILVEHEANTLLAKSHSREVQQEHGEQSKEDMNNTSNHLSAGDGLLKGIHQNSKNDVSKLDVFEDGTHAKDVEAYQYTCMDIFRSKTMFLYAFVMCFLW